METRRVSMKNDALLPFVEKLLSTDLEGNRNNPVYKKEVLRNVKMFFTWLEKEKLNEILDIGRKEIYKYYQYICEEKSVTGTRYKGEPLSKRTINGRLLAVKKVFAVLYREGLIKNNPLQNISFDIPQDRVASRDVITEKDISIFLEKIDTSTPIGLRDRTLYELIYSSGLRVSEAARLYVGNLNLDDREIIVKGKYERDRVIPISIVARDFLIRYLGNRINKQDEPVFLGSRSWVKNKAMRSKEISRRFRTLLLKFNMDAPKRSTHSIRHSTATHLLDNGASIRHVQELLGHKNIENTARYTQVKMPLLAKVFKKYHPGENEIKAAVNEDYLEKIGELG